MPNVVIEFKKYKRQAEKTSIVKFLSELLAKQLSCSEKQLNENDFSIKIYSPELGSKMADCEITIFAHNYTERVERQDEIALAIKKAVMEQFTEMTSVNVSLLLLSYGFSFENK